MNMKLKLIPFLIILAFLSAKSQTAYPNMNINLLSNLSPEKHTGGFLKYSGCWGWHQAAKNKEYAILGTHRATFFVDISDPKNPVVKDSVLAWHDSCIWREVKTYQNYCYIVSDACTPNAFQIVDMQYLPDSVHVVYEDTLLFERAHTLWVDENKLYVASPAKTGKGAVSMQVFSLANPATPVLLRSLNDDFPSIGPVHDMFVRKDTAYVSSGWPGLLVYKFDTGSNTFISLGSLSGYAEAGYNHSSYITPNGKNLVFCDEVPANVSIKVADVSNLSNISVVGTMRPNMDVNFTGHNPYVYNNQYVFVSCYQDGLVLYDISNPASPFLAGYFDTYPQGGTGFVTDYHGNRFNGNWGAYCYFPSGVILALDMQNGMFLLEANSLLGTSIGINEQEKILPKLSVFPNPASHELMISFETDHSNYDFEITNLIGQQIHSEKNIQPGGENVEFKWLNVSDLAPGTYVIKVKQNQKSIHQKFIITR
jgi:choice-of-anchor B domain-containing protein